VCVKGVSYGDPSTIEENTLAESAGCGRGNRVFIRQQITIPNSDDVEQAVETEAGDGLVGILADQWLGAIGDAHSSQAEHGDVVGTIADRDHLLQGNSLPFRDFSQQDGLPVSIHNGRNHAAGDLAVCYLQFVGIDVVNAQILLQVLCEKVETAGEDGRFVAEKFQRANQPLGAIGKGNRVEQGARRRVL